MTAPKKPLAPGDRVAVYSGLSRCIGIVESTTEGLALVRVGLNVRTYHVKQCRRLVRRERRRVWIDEPGLRKLETGQDEVWASTTAMPRAVEFVEARKVRK
jgi:hypothetical protein